VRKHFEIPAAGSCLLTERTPSIEAAGFVDMENCVFADEHDVLDKLDYLFAFPERLAAITRAGHELTLGRHTAAQRDEVRQWLTLRQARRPGQRIVQRSPFGRLELTDNPTIVTAPVISDGVDRVLMRQGDDELRQRRYERARELYLRCLNYHPMPEPGLRLAICDLYQGRANHAIDRLVRSTEMTQLGRAADPDPVEWAYLIRAMACAGRLADARLDARQYPAMRHPELDRTRAAVLVLSGEKHAVLPTQTDGGPARRRSVHVLPTLEIEQWVGEFATMLVACGQGRLASKLHEGLRAGQRSDGANGNQDSNPAATTDSGPLQAVEPPRVMDEVIVQSRRLRRKVQRRAARERLRFTRERALDPLSALIRDVAEKEDLAAVLLIGPPTQPYREVLVAALEANPSRPVLATDSAAGPATSDFVIVDAGDEQAASTVEQQQIFDARLVLVDHLNTVRGQELCAELLGDTRYVLVEHEPAAGQGFALFRRLVPHGGSGNHGR
jgi:hypothetical protein